MEGDQGILKFDIFQPMQGYLGMMILNGTLIAAVALIIIAINKKYAFLGGVTALSASLFLLLQACFPSLSAQWCEGSLVAFISILCTAILFSCYENKYSMSEVFLIFVLLSAFSLWQVAFVYLIPLFIIGVIQVRIFSAKAAITIIFGIITPYWIALGTGIVSIEDLQYPALVPIFKTETLTRFFWGALGVAAIGIISVFSNVINLIKYKLQTRVYNGFILFMMLVCLVMIFFDYNNVQAYFPLMNAVVSMQIAHLFAVSNFKRRYIFIFLLLILMGAFYTWQVI